MVPTPRLLCDQSLWDILTGSSGGLETGRTGVQLVPKSVCEHSFKVSLIGVVQHPHDTWKENGSLEPAATSLSPGLLAAASHTLLLRKDHPALQFQITF